MIKKSTPAESSIFSPLKAASGIGEAITATETCMKRKSFSSKGILSNAIV